MRFVNPGGSLDDSQNFIQLKFERLPRFYRICRAIKLFRLYGLEKNIFEFLEKIKVPLNVIKMILIFIKLLLLVHIIACCWATSANFELNTNENWLFDQSVQDEDMYDKYMVAFYWAVVTTTTVGYGDVVPVNKFEIGLALIIIICGVAYYSYVIGNLSFLFASILGEKTEQARRKDQIKRILSVQNLPEELIERITVYKEEIDEIVAVLPTNLRAQILLVLYKDPISVIPCLKTKNPHFIIEYLPKLQPIIVKKGTTIMARDTFPSEVFFIYQGTIKNKNNDKLFSDGNIIGETDIIYNRTTRIETFEAVKDAYMFRLDRTTFENLMNEVPEFRTKVETLANERETARIHLNASMFKGDKKNYLSRKNRIRELVEQLEKGAEDIDNNILEKRLEDQLPAYSSEDSESEYSNSSSDDDSSSQQTASFNDNQGLKRTRSMLQYNSIRNSQSKIVNLKQSLKTQLQDDSQAKLVNNDDKIKPFEEEKVKPKHNVDDTNPLESGNDESLDTDDNAFEGGDDETEQSNNNKKSKKKRIKVKRKKVTSKSNAIGKDMQKEIELCTKLIGKARRITNEYSKIFSKVEKHATGLSLGTK